MVGGFKVPEHRTANFHFHPVGRTVVGVGVAVEGAGGGGAEIIGQRSVFYGYCHPFNMAVDPASLYLDLTATTPSPSPNPPPTPSVLPSALPLPVSTLPRGLH